MINNIFPQHSPIMNNCNSNSHSPTQQLLNQASLLLAQHTDRTVAAGAAQRQSRNRSPISRSPRLSPSSARCSPQAARSGIHTNRDLGDLGAAANPTILAAAQQQQVQQMMLGGQLPGYPAYQSYLGAYQEQQQALQRLLGLDFLTVTQQYGQMLAGAQKQQFNNLVVAYQQHQQQLLQQQQQLSEHQAQQARQQRQHRQQMQRIQYRNNQIINLERTTSELIQLDDSYPRLTTSSESPPLDIEAHSEQAAAMGNNQESDTTTNRNTNTSTTTTTDTNMTQDGGVNKPLHSYIGLIGMAILSTPQKMMVLNDIYNYIMTHYPQYKDRLPGWRNSIRHNLSLNECFQKADRAPNGKGHYWTIHPANMEDFMNGDFRRKRAQRKVRMAHNMELTPEDLADEQREREGSIPPVPEHFKRSIEMHRQIEEAAKSNFLWASKVAAESIRHHLANSQDPKLQLLNNQHHQHHHQHQHQHQQHRAHVIGNQHTHHHH